MHGETVEVPAKKYIKRDNEAIILNAGNTLTCTAKNPRKPGKLEIYKVDAADHETPVERAVFGVTSDWREARAQFETDSEGRISIENVPVGTYIATEVETPNDYYKAIENLEVEAKQNLEPRTYVVDEPRYPGKLIFYKVDKLNHITPVKGAKFTIYDNITKKFVHRKADGTLYEEETIVSDEGYFVTGEDGIIKVDPIPCGEYTVTEVEAPPLYKRLEEPFIVIATKEEPTPGTYTIDNERFVGDMEIYKVDEADRKTPVAGAVFVFKDNITGWYVNRRANGEIYYTENYDGEEAKFVTDENGKITILTVSNDHPLYVGDYTAIEIQAPPNYQVCDPFTVTAKQRKEDGTPDLDSAPYDYKIPNVRQKGHLKIIKIDRDNHEIKLKGVQFRFRDKLTGWYVQRKPDGTIDYVEDENAEGTIFTTDDNGEIFLEDLYVGEYDIIEVQTDEYYEFDKNNELTITVSKDSTLTKEIVNIQIYIDLSGYVWVDENAGKESLRNALYHDDEFDNKDILLNGVTVRLMRNGTAIAETQTQALDNYASDGIYEGVYVFKKVSIYDEDDIERADSVLDECYIEFEYDGMTWTNVTPHLDKDNGSKAIEGENRDIFNRKFAKVDGSNVNPTNDTGLQRIEDNGASHELSYTRDKPNYRATVNYDSNWLITADTKKAGYDIEENRVKGKQELKYIKELKYINLGIQRRAQPRMSLTKDLNNTTLGINGYWHTYYYSQKDVPAIRAAVNTNGEEDFGTTHTQESYREAVNGYNGGFNVGVKFESQYIPDTYKRAIYESDITYQEPGNANPDLQIFMIYKIKVLNESQELTSQVHQIVDYYDNEFKLDSVSTSEPDEKGNLPNALSADKIHIDSNYNNGGYAKVVLDIGDKISSGGESPTYYLKFELSKDRVLGLINGQKSLKNVAEILSYSTYDSAGGIYAGFDDRSVPGDADPTDITTFEDDTDRAPDLKLELADARELTGKVFEDSTSNGADIKTGEIRQGDGEYKDGESGIANVTVTLKEKTGSNQVYTVTTGSNGDFKISGFIPGQYDITYTWGNVEYPVQQYKATIYNDRNRYNTNQGDKYWYKTNIDTRLSDAIDNYTTRKEIDDQTSKIPSIGFTKNGSIANNTVDYTAIDNETKITTMNSTTPEMEFNVEYETVTTASSGDKYTYEVKNIDFGIVERARQAMAIDKKVSHIKIILPDDTTTLVDADVDQTNGKLVGETGGLAVYLAPVNNNEGKIKVELDTELIQNSRIIITYKIAVKNCSEKDFVSEAFYTYGEQTGPEVTLSANGVYDYLDSELTSSDTNTGWVTKTREEYEEEVGPMTVQEFRKKVNSLDPSGTSIEKEYKFYSTEQQTRTNWYKETQQTRTENFANRIIVFSDRFKDILPGQTHEETFEATKMLASSDEIELDNEAEITRIEKNGGSIPNLKQKNYDEELKLYDTSETVIITPVMGGNRNYALIIAIAVSTLAILGTGIILIKKKVLRK